MKYQPPKVRNINFYTPIGVRQFAGELFRADGIRPARGLSV